MKAANLLFGLFFLLLIASCNQNEVYFKYQHVSESGWHKDSLLTFDYNIQDTTAQYNVFIHIRHYGNYPYQNFWLFLENTDAKGVVVKDTAECFLANEYGKWLGRGTAVKEMPVFYKEQIILPDSGNYKIQIGHGMRDTLLVGIKDIGIRIEKVD